MESHRKLLKIPFKGMSMSPSLKEGDILFVSEDEKKEFKFGDIIVFVDKSKEIVAHRVISLSPLIVKGDRSLVFDQVKKENILGVVKSVRKKRSGVILEWRQPFVVLICLISSLKRENTLSKPYSVLIILLSYISLLGMKRSTQSHIE